MVQALGTAVSPESLQAKHAALLERADAVPDVTFADLATPGLDLAVLVRDQAAGSAGIAGLLHDEGG
jgi:hypothetical protein